MDWDPSLGEAQPVLIRNRPSAFEEAVFVTAAVAYGVAARTMRAFPRDSLKCILLLGVAFNSAGKSSAWACLRQPECSPPSATLSTQTYCNNISTSNFNSN